MPSPARTAGPGTSAGKSSAGGADGEQAVPAAADGTAVGDGQPDAAREPDPAVIAEAAGKALAIVQAAEAAGKALAAGDLQAALADMDTVREQADQGRRVLKAAARGRRAPAVRPGSLRDLVEQHLRKFPGESFTPYQTGKVLARSSGAVANALDRLVSLGIAELATDKPRSFRLAPGAPPAPRRQRAAAGRRGLTKRLAAEAAGAA